MGLRDHAPVNSPELLAFEAKSTYQVDTPKSWLLIKIRQSLIAPVADIWCVLSGALDDRQQDHLKETCSM